MAYTISDLTIIDVPSLISIYVSAFSDNPLYRVLWLDTHAASQSYGAYVGEEMFGDKKVRMRKAVVEDDGARGSGEMVAFAIWLLVEPEEDPGAGASAGAGTDTNPLISSAEAQTNFSLSKSEGLDDDERVAAEVEMKAKRVLARNSDNPSTDVAAMVEAFSKQVSLMKDREGLQSMRHILLDNLVTYPSHQNRGAASALLEDGVEFARSQSQSQSEGGVLLPMYVSAMMTAREFYEKRGFGVVGGFEFDLEGWESETNSGTEDADEENRKESEKEKGRTNRKGDTREEGSGRHDGGYEKGDASSESKERIWKQWLMVKKYI